MTMATMLATTAGVNFRLARGWGAERPEVCAESGGVDPGATPPPGSSPDVCAGSGSGGWAVMVIALTPSGPAYS